jgi:hypothetical protein
MNMELTKSPSERLVLVGRQVLIAEENDQVVQKCFSKIFE